MRVLTMTAVLGMFPAGVGFAQDAPAPRQIEPNAVRVDQYVSNEYLDPNLLAIQVRRAEDRILALEQTNERLIRGYNDLAEKYNALREYMNAGVVLEK
jgi:hypothetical protein